MKTKIVIGLLSVALVGTGTYAITNTNQLTAKLDKIPISIKEKQNSVDVSSFELEMNSLKEEIKTLKLEIATLNEDLTSLQTKNEELVNTKNTLNTKFNSQQNELNTLKTNYNNLNNAYTADKNYYNIVGKYKSDSSDITYEFFEDGTFSINENKTDNYKYSKGIISLGYTVWFYQKVNDSKLIIISGTPSGTFRQLYCTKIQ